MKIDKEWNSRRKQSCCYAKIESRRSKKLIFFHMGILDLCVVRESKTKTRKLMVERASFSILIKRGSKPIVKNPYHLFLHLDNSLFQPNTLFQPSWSDQNTISRTTKLQLCVYCCEISDKIKPQTDKSFEFEFYETKGNILVKKSFSRTSRISLAYAAVWKLAIIAKTHTK